MVVVDLVTDRKLLDFKFEGYKLSLDSIPVLKRAVPVGVEQFRLTGKEYSFLQCYMSSRFNHLFQDPFAQSCVFFVDKTKSINSCSFSQGTHLSTPRIVWKFPIQSHEAGANSAMVFPSSEWAVVCNGNSIIYLLNTPSRAAGEPWMLCHSFEIPNCTSTSYLLYGMHLSMIGREQIDCILTYFDEMIDNDSKNTKVVCILEWLSFTCGQNICSWSLKRTRRLTGTSSLHYVALEPSCDALYLASEKKFAFIHDSDIPVLEKTVEKKTEVPPLYTYQQSFEDITIDFNLSQDVTKDDICVRFGACDLEVSFQNISILKGTLQNKIEPGSCTWALDDKLLKLNLKKSENGLMWPELIIGDKTGKEVVDPTLAAEIHSRLSHLTSDKEEMESSNMPFNLDEIEECDIHTVTSTFSRMDGNAHRETHEIHFGGHQCLFTCQPSPENLPVICLRHNVDGVVWQPMNSSSEREYDSFKMKHIATFSAFGYVQASKQNMRFCSCAPDYAYSVITDCRRHIYIYSQPESLNSALQLRNRKTGQAVSHVAKQHVINLEDCSEILGLQIAPEGIFILSSNMLYLIKKEA